MTSASNREPVRLGTHCGRSIFEQARGLHDDAAGLVVIPGGPSGDPLVMFQEHGMDETCQYFDLRPTSVLAPGMRPDEKTPQLRSMVGDPDIRRNWFALRHIFTQEDPAFANKIITSLRAEMGHGGLAPLVAVSRRFQRRWTVIRMLASAQSQPDRPLPDFVGAPHALDLHGNAIYRTYVYAPLVLLGSPFTRGFVTGRGVVESGETVLFVLMAGVGDGQVIKEDEITWSTIYEADLPSLRALGSDGKTWMAETNRPAHDIDASMLLAWWTRNVNVLFSEATDLGRYRHDGGLLNAGKAHRELLTLERLIANCIRIQTRPTDHLTRVVLAYEFFDLLPSLVAGHFAPPHVWGRLANPAIAKRILDRVFADSPDPVRMYFRKRTNAVLNKLQEETLAHVVGDLSSKKVDVGGTPYPHDTYIAQLLHQFRNTHHGYELDEPRKTMLLASHDGHVSAAFPELVVLYTIALIADSKTALDGGWL